HGIRKIALFDVLVKINKDALLLVLGELPLGHLRLGPRLCHVWNMGKSRQRTAQCLEEEKLRKCVRKMLVRPDDVGDLHFDVVNYTGEIVKRAAVGANNDKIADLVR